MEEFYNHENTRLMIFVLVIWLILFIYIKNMKQDLKEYLQEVIIKLEGFEDLAERVQGSWNGDESGTGEEIADTYKQIQDSVSILRNTAELTLFNLKTME